MNYSDYRIILASGSPRRKDLLSKAGLTFEIIRATGEERTDETVPERMVSALSRNKAAEVYRKLMKEDAFKSDQRPLLILSADTVVSLDGEVLGKPKDEADARRMLTLLSGRTHAVSTGYTVYLKRPGRVLRSRTAFVNTAVTFRPVSPEEIDAYVLTGEPMDKAGAYAIQGIGGKFVSSVAGSRDNVVGFPVKEVLETVERLVSTRIFA